MKKIVVLAVICCFFLSGCVDIPAYLTSQQATPVLKDHGKVTLLVGEKKLLVEVVTSTESLAQGLSDRDSIGSDGMLFILPERQIATFWMKDMKFGLDFVWIDNTTVVDLTENVPPPAAETPLRQLPIYSPKQPVTAVLEVPIGSIAQHQFALGDTIRFEP